MRLKMRKRHLGSHRLPARVGMSKIYRPRWFYEFTKFRVDAFPLNKEKKF